MKQGTSPQLDSALRGLSEAGLVHHDSWVADMLRLGQTKDALAAKRHLALAVEDSSKGDADGALQEATAAEENFGKANMTPGLLRAKVEEIYALQRQGRAKECLTRAAPLLPVESLSHYPWLHAYLLLENAACRAAQGDAEGYVQDATEAGRLAHAASLPLETLRSQGFVVSGLDALGRTGEAWALAQQGLQECVQIRGSRMPTYQFLQSIYRAVKARGLYQEAEGVADAASHASDFVANRQIQAYAHELLGRTATESGNSVDAQRAFHDATQALQSLPAGPATRLYSADWEADRSEWLARQGRLNEALEEITRADSAVAAVDDYTVRQRHYAEFARLLLLGGDGEAAMGRLSPLLQQAEVALASTRGEVQRLSWERDNGRGYRLLVEDLANRKQPEAALASWEWYRASPYRAPLLSKTHWNDATGPNTGPLPPERLRTLTIVIARIEDEYLVWSVGGVSGERVRMVRVAVHADEMKDAAQTLAELCGHRESSEQSIQASGRRLYHELFGAFADQIGQAERLQLDVDPSLAHLPFAALVQPDGRYFGLTHSLSFLPAWWSVTSPTNKDLNHPPSVLLVEGRLAGAASKDGASLVLPAEYLETKSLHARFPQAEVLRGPEASTKSVTNQLAVADIFHFSGHTVMQAGESVLFLSDRENTLGAAVVGRLSLQELRLAVLAACSSTGGREYSSSDTQSLTHAFLSAGTAQVISTLWDVDTRSSRDLMVELYAQLREPSSAAEALCKAQTHLQSIPATASPYYWASMQVFQQ